MGFLRGRRKVTAETALDGADPDGIAAGLWDIKWSVLTASIDRALRIFDARREAGAPATELQLVLQVAPGGPGFAKWRKERERSLRRTSSRHAAVGWPTGLPEGHVGVLLAPYPPGQQVGPALIAARLAALPEFAEVKLRRAGEADLVAARLLRSWLHGTEGDGALVLAPPILEYVAGPGVARQEPFDLGLVWPLAPAAGLVSS